MIYDIPFGGHYDGGEPKAGDKGQEPKPPEEKPQRFNEEQIKQIGGIVSSAITDSQKSLEEEGGGDYLAPEGGSQQGYDPSQDPNSPQYQYQGEQGGQVEQGGQYTPPPDPNAQRLDGLESTALHNRSDITRMTFKSDLDDMIIDNPALRPLRADALKKQAEYAKTGQIINANTIVDLMVGEASRKKTAEDRALNTTNPGGDLEPTGATPPKHPMEMTAEEIEEKWGKIPI